MSVRTWSDDYVSGFSEIDTHHKTLFAMINSFADENDEHTSINTIMEFLDSLMKYCEYHFSCEEKIMTENNYPLVEYHKDIHKDLTNTVKKIRAQLGSNSIKDPYIAVVGFSTDWLNNHIASDDLSFLSFYKNRDYDLSANFLGKQCTVAKLNNEILGMGKIKSIHKNEVVIEHLVEKRLPLEVNDMVKVSAPSSRSSTQMFIAKTYYSGPEEIKLFNATVIMTLNRRQHFRVTADIEAVLWLGDMPFPVSIVNIGAGGALINLQRLLAPSQEVKLEFVVENNRFMENCREIHAIKRVGAPNSYGLEFTAMADSQLDKLITYVFNRQTLTQRNILR
jgi:hemerythrin-like metal-binding protein